MDIELQTKIQMLDMFNRNNWNVYVVELSASLNERLQRNTTDNRLKHKPSKRDYNSSEESLLKAEQKFVFNTVGWNDFRLPRYVKKHLIITNEHKTAINVAIEIAKELNLYDQATANLN